MDEDDNSLQPLSDSQRADLEVATTRYAEARTAEHAMYLMGRGLDPQTMVTHRVGSVVDPAPGHARYRGKLAIPYLAPDGHSLQLRFRCTEDHNCRENNHGKYLTVGGEPARMFNVGAIARAGSEIHVTEGEFDAMILEQIGLHAVAIPGANTWKPHHRRMLAGFSKVYIWGDPDEAGADFVNRLTKAMRQAVAVDLKVGDVTDTYLDGGAEALMSLIK